MNDLHEHECPDPKCATVWKHSSLEGLFDPTAHHCPKCGKEQLYKRKFVKAAQKMWARQRKTYRGERLKRRVRYVLSLLDRDTKEALKKAKLEPINTREAEYMFDTLNAMKVDHVEWT